MDKLQELKQLIDDIYLDILEPDEISATQLYEMYPEVAQSTLRGRMEKLVREGKITQRKVGTKWVYKMVKKI